MVEKTESTVELPLRFEWRAAIRKLFGVPPIDSKVREQFLRAKKKLRKARKKFERKQKRFERKNARRGREREYSEFGNANNFEILEEYETAHAAKKLFGRGGRLSRRTKFRF